MATKPGAADRVPRLAKAAETRALPPREECPFSPKGLRSLAAAPARAGSRGGGRGRTEISLAQKEHIQQLWRLPETQIRSGLISLGLCRRAKSKSYYALSRGQGLTPSGMGEMLPWPPGSPDASFSHT